MAVAAVAGLILLLTVPPASAQPIAGAHYSGSVTGAGEIIFDVSAAGDQVLNLRVTHIPCDHGWHDVFPWPIPIPIVGDTFDGTLPPLLTRVWGQFPTKGNANGTFLLVLSDCQSPTLPWTATGATLGVGGIAELAEATGSSVPNYIPLAGLAGAALVALTAGRWHARRRRLR
jgi:hypothetical protein